MSNPLVLSFDIGTQSARAFLVGPDGTILVQAKKSYDEPYYSKQGGWAEQSAAFYWECVRVCAHNVKEQSGDRWNEIAAVVCTTIRDTCLCLDKNNEPLRDAILWLDNRRAENLPPIPAPLSGVLRAAGLFGKVDDMRRNSHCNWLASEEKEIWRRTEKFVFLSAWLNFRFCGTLADSDASVIGHMPFDYKNRRWQSKSDFTRFLWEAVTDGMFCELAAPGTILGKITARCAEETGIPEGVPFAASGSDKGCETLGLSCLGEDKAALSFGTTATVQLSSKKYFEPLPMMPAYPAVVPGFYNPEIEIYRGYWLLSWFKQEFAAKETAEAERLGVDAEQVLDRGLAKISPGCDGLVMQPYFTPGLDMPHAKGAFIGFSDSHTRLHLYRAIIEGINFALMDGLRRMEKRGGMKITSLYAAGGGSKSDEVCAITATMFGLPLYRTQSSEAAGIGSAIAAFVGTGVFPNWEEGVARMVHTAREFLPDMDAHKIYASLFEKIYEKIYGRLAPLYGELDTIFRGHKHGA